MPRFGRQPGQHREQQLRRARFNHGHEHSFLSCYQTLFSLWYTTICGLYDILISAVFRFEAPSFFPELRCTEDLKLKCIKRCNTVKCLTGANAGESVAERGGVGTVIGHQRAHTFESRTEDDVQAPFSSELGIRATTKPHHDGVNGLCGK